MWVAKGKVRHRAFCHYRLPKTSSSAGANTSYASKKVQKIPEDEMAPDVLQKFDVCHETLRFFAPFFPHPKLAFGQAGPA